MSWLIVKKWLSKSGLWLKHHWYIPLSGLAVLVSYVLFKEKAESLMKALMDNRDGYKEQAQKVNEIHDKQISERNKHIANELQRSIRTIEDHRSNLMKKFDTDNVVDLVHRFSHVRQRVLAG